MIANSRLLTAAIAAALLGSSVELAAATLTVTTTADAGPGSLRQTIGDAANGDQIEFAVSGSIALTSGELLVDKDLTIAGPGAGQLTLSGGNLARVLHADQATLTVSGLTFADGATTEGGGGIFIEGQSSVTIEGAVFRDNSAAWGGGVYVADSSSATISDSTFSANEATGQYGGGAIFAYDESDLTLENSIISNNQASDGVAGGIAVELNSEATIRSVTLSGNSSMHCGGGLYVYSSEVLVRNSTIGGNQVIDGPGGGICSGYYAATVLRASTVSGNSARESAGVHGRWSDYVYLVNSTVSDNHATDTGGGIGIEGYYTALYLLHATIADNSAANGGGIHINGEAGFPSVQVISSIVSGNTGGDCAPSGSGYWYAQGQNLDSDATCAGFSHAGVDPLLGALAANGGPTLTMLPATGSPAIGAATDCVDFYEQPVPVDQRGMQRPQDGNGDGTAACDLGAVEVASDAIFADGFEP